MIAQERKKTYNLFQLIALYCKRKDIDKAEHTLFRKLESLWGVTIFYADETGETIQSLGVFSEKQNPLTVSEELRRSLICQAKEQNVPAICKISEKINFICEQNGTKYYL